MNPHIIFNVCLILGLFGSPVTCLSGIKLLYYSLKESTPDVPFDEAFVDPSKQLKVIVHGLDAPRVVHWYDPLIQAYLEKGYQVLAIDWRKYACDRYEEAVEIVFDVGAVIAQYITSVKDIFALLR